MHNAVNSGEVSSPVAPKVAKQHRR